MDNATQSFLRLNRTLHTYLTMFSSIVLFLFALTGFMLNHGAWFGLKEGGKRPVAAQEGAAQPPAERSATAPARGEQGREPPTQKEDVADRGGAPRAQRGDIAAERDGGRPGQERGVLVKLTSLHKGKPASLPVVLLIDTSAVMLMLGSITGIIMLLSLPRKRRLGLIVMAVGTIGALAVYVALAS